MPPSKPSQFCVNIDMADWICKAQLGSGGFGIVHVWSNAKTGQIFALKKCKFGSDMALTARLGKQSVYILVNFSLPNN